MLTFQQLILRLQSYWDAQGCALLQPYDMEVGAGTSHTATFLRALGPEPWKAAYVQPSRRPKDGRYGENPNRRERMKPARIRGNRVILHGSDRRQQPTGPLQYCPSRLLLAACP